MLAICESVTGINKENDSAILVLPMGESASTLRCNRADHCTLSSDWDDPGSITEVGIDPLFDSH